MTGLLLALLLQIHPLNVQSASFGTPDVVLPSASGAIPFYTVKVLPSAAAVTVRAPGVELVDGAKTFAIAAGGAVTFRAINGTWHVVGAYSTAVAGSGTPASAVVTETAFGQASAVGTSTDYARADHTHGTPTIADGDVPNTITIDLAAAATALAANPANCADATHFSTGINASGTADCEAIADADVPNNITITLAAAATALAANGTNCGAGNYARGVDASGNAEDCTAAGGGSTPTGTGFRHVTGGVEDAASKLVDTADINDDQVTWAKTENVASASILGRESIGAGDIEELAVNSPLILSSGLSLGTVSIAQGGTGQTTASGARAALGINALVVAADHVINSASYTNINNLTLSMTGGATYTFSCVLRCTQSVAGDQCWVAPSATTAATWIGYAQTIFTSATAHTTASATAYDNTTGLPATGATTAGLPHRVEGSVVLGSTGTFTLRARRDAGAGTTTILRGSYCVVIG